MRERPMISRAAYQAASDAARRAVPVLIAKGYIVEAHQTMQRADLYAALAKEEPPCSGNPSS